MRRPASLPVLWMVALLLIALQPHATYARPVQTWTVDQLAAKAEVLALGEVLQVTTAGNVAPDQTHWRIPLLQKTARIRVLRLFPQRGKMDIAAGNLISLQYLAIDIEKVDGVANGPEFPVLSQGDLFVFPLQNAGTPDKPNWQLLHEEDFGLLVPSVRQPLQDAWFVTGAEFLRSELAAAFSNGPYPAIYRAGRYLSQVSHSDNTLVPILCNLLEKRLKDDEARWLDIAVATYCSMGIPRPNVEDLLKLPDDATTQPWLIAKALSHVQGDGIVERFIEVAIKHADVHLWGTASMLQLGGYSRRPAVLKLLQEKLKEDSAEAIYLAYHAVRDDTGLQANHPLMPAALASAVRILSNRAKSEHNALAPACELVRDCGSDREFGLLLDEFKRSQTEDRKRYWMLWQSTAYGNTKRMVPVCRIVIEDQQAFSDRYRYCDMACAELQRVTKEAFGFDGKQPIADRDAAIRKAKAWLAEHGQ